MSSKAPTLQDSIKQGEVHRVFPPEIYGVIGRCLAATHYLRTLASLNVTSRDIHFETMPTLYETVNFRVPQRVAQYEAKLCTVSEGFRYTKFCVFGEWKNNTRILPATLLRQLRTFTNKMPNLKATFITNRNHPAARLCCYIYLHKPVTISEVFACVAVSPLLSPHGLDVVNYELDRNAYLIPDERAMHAANGPFDVRISLQWLIAKDAADESHIIDSLVELLKLGGYQRQHVDIIDPPPPHDPDIPLQEDCCPAKVDYFAEDGVWGWPLTKLYLTCPQIRIFADKLALAAENCPRILRNQLQIGLKDRVIDAKSLSASLDRLHNLYRCHLSAPFALLPSPWSALPIPRTDTIIDISRIDNTSVGRRVDLEYVSWSRTLNLCADGRQSDFSFLTNVWDVRDDEYADPRIFQRH